MSGMTLFHAPCAVTRSSTKRVSVGPKRYLTSLQTETDPSGKCLQRLRTRCRISTPPGPASARRASQTELLKAALLLPRIFLRGPPHLFPVEAVAKLLILTPLFTLTLQPCFTLLGTNLTLLLSFESPPVVALIGVLRRLGSVPTLGINRLGLRLRQRLRRFFPAG